MSGTFSVKTEPGGELIITLSVQMKEGVNELAIDMMDAGLETQYEPGNRNGIYTCCFLCNEKARIRIDTCRE